MTTEDSGSGASRHQLRTGNSESPPEDPTGSDDGAKADKAASDWLTERSKRNFLSHKRRGLFIGIDHYQVMPKLHCCVQDARAMAIKLATNEDASDNFARRLLISPGPEPVTRETVRRHCEELFHGSAEEVLLYFSGHGMLDDAGGFLVTEEGRANDPGIYLDELLALADRSDAKTVTMIMDTCFAESLGNPAMFQTSRNRAVLRDGMTILASSRGVAVEGLEHGLFTGLMLDALEGGAADILGNVTAASVYAYVEQILGARHQRPIYKSYASSLRPLRRCAPEIGEEILSRILEIFPRIDSTIRLDPTYEFTSEESLPENVRTFNDLKELRNVGLLKTEARMDLYYLAMGKKRAWLSRRGRLYWHLMDSRRQITKPS